MNAHPLPSRAPLDTTAAGVKRRELVLILTAVGLGLLILVLPLGPILGRVALAFGLGGALVVYAFWRVDRQWTIEGWLYGRLQYARREKRFVRGGEHTRQVEKQAGESKIDIPPLMRSAAQDTNDVLFWIQAYTNGQLLARVGSVALLAVFLTWSGTGGVVRAQQWIRSLAR
ncbi:MAG: hypothetical protein JXB38_00215 [Anaerolineales bacterium]|nr:hypothetical protein [Anaerolineales bacterium]